MPISQISQAIWITQASRTTFSLNELSKESKICAKGQNPSTRSIRFNGSVRTSKRLKKLAITTSLCNNSWGHEEWTWLALTSKCSAENSKNLSPIATSQWKWSTVTTSCCTIKKTLPISNKFSTVFCVNWPRLSKEFSILRPTQRRRMHKFGTKLSESTRKAKLLWSMTRCRTRSTEFKRSYSILLITKINQRLSYRAGVGLTIAMEKN